MPKTFTATYQVADGYVSGDRPQRFRISEGDFEDNDDEAYLREFYHQSVQEDFEQCIFPEAENEEAFVAWAKERIAERNDKSDD